MKKSLYLGWLIGFFGQTEFALHESRDSEFYSSKTMARLGIESTLGMRDVEITLGIAGLREIRLEIKKSSILFLETWSKT